ncbi:hypothetical protein lerEdw1_008521 [Lerista edwardsae]|nr:hypothetical protein lerEdw1_008521 [Lerista edwardsae]
MFQLLGKIFPWVYPPRPVETLNSAQSPDRPVRQAKKRLGLLARFLLVFIPSRFQRLLGYLPMDSLGDNPIPQETLEAPVNPSGKGSKRKHDDLVPEENWCWVEALQEELPDEDDPEDPTYVPSKSSDSASEEEYKSQNNTETDVELEEKDGEVMLKDNPNQLEAPSGDGKLGEAQAGANEEKALIPQTSGDGSEHLTKQALKSSDGKSVTLKDQADENGKDAQSQEALGRSAPGAADITASTDSQEQWVEVSGGHRQQEGTGRGSPKSQVPAAPWCRCYSKLITKLLLDVMSCSDADPNK